MAALKALPLGEKKKWNPLETSFRKPHLQKEKWRMPVFYITSNQIKTQAFENTISSI